MRLWSQLFSWMLLGAWSAAADPQVDRLFALARAVNPGLSDYTAEVDIDLQASAGPLHYQPKASGTYFYKKADKHKLEVSGLPSQLRKYPMVFGFNLPHLEKFTAAVAEETNYKGRAVYHCRLIPISPDDSMRQIDLLIDKANFTVPNYVNSYKNAGIVRVDIEYTTVDHFTVFESMKAQADFPSAGIVATGEAKYRHYLFNKNLPDSLFGNGKPVAGRRGWVLGTVPAVSPSSRAGLPLPVLVG